MSQAPPRSAGSFAWYRTLPCVEQKGCDIVVWKSVITGIEVPIHTTRHGDFPVSWGKPVRHVTTRKSRKR